MCILSHAILFIRLDREEVREWILPSDYNHAHAEAAHLIHESDMDSVGLDYGSAIITALQAIVWL